MILGFLFSAWRWGDWKNWEKYYPTVLFMVVVNLAASFLTYHHILWKYNPDILMKTQTTVEMLNAFVQLPAVAFIFLSKFPSGTKARQFAYIVLWVLIFASLEFTAHYIVGSLSYQNGWSWFVSVAFDCAIFSILRLHHLKPVWAWLSVCLLTAIILVVFNFDSAEMK